MLFQMSFSPMNNVQFETGMANVFLTQFRDREVELPTGYHCITLVPGGGTNSGPRSIQTNFNMSLLRN